MVSTFMQSSPITAGQYHLLKVKRRADFGFYLDDGGEGLLLPIKLAPRNLKTGDEVKVFVYHDSENRLIATTQQPKAVVGDIALMQVVAVTGQGAFLDWGLMKDLFVPVSQQLGVMRKGGEYLVKLYIDEMTGRVAATEKIEPQLNREPLNLKEMDPVDLIAYRTSELGWVMIINNAFTGILHSSDIFTPIQKGDHLKGYIKKIRPDNKIDLALGVPGYAKVEGEADKILRLLEENRGFLPYNDKSAPEDIYGFFGMSKKTFKMTTGHLYKQKRIAFTDTGIQLLDTVE
ncbi:MAG: S1 RNA-binding domain-containing protein [Bacteroidota bacterium]